MSQSNKEDVQQTIIEPPYFDITKDISKFKSKIEEAETDIKAPSIFEIFLTFIVLSLVIMTMKGVQSFLEGVYGLDEKLVNYKTIFIKEGLPKIVKAILSKKY